MIHLTDGWAVERLLRRAIAAPALFDYALLCAPFVDATTLRTVAELARRGCPLVVVTTPMSAPAVDEALTASSGVWRVFRRNRLHAKVYLLKAQAPTASEVVVTSANLTMPALRTNVEIGVRAVPTTQAGRSLFLEAGRMVLGSERIDFSRPPQRSAS